MGKKISRRTFTKTTAAASFALTAAQTATTRGANERIRLGFIGVANRLCNGPANVSSGTPKANGSPTPKKPTTCCITNIASRGS